MALLIAYDGSAPSENAVEHAIAEHADTEMVLLHVVEVPGGATSASFGLVKEEIHPDVTPLCATTRDR